MLRRAQGDEPLKMKRIARRQEIPNYVDTLDGFRALGTFLVLSFHYWQQSWVSTSFQIGSLKVELGPFVTMGSLGMELLFVISGFCLYYPLALHPKRKLHLGQYLYKRAVRILPTYFLCVLICSAYQIGKLSPSVLKSQFIANMTFTQMSTAVLANNKINGVLWSIAIEVQFYILFPMLVWLFRKSPFWTMAGAFLIGEGWRTYLWAIDSSNISWLMNQLPAMIDVFVGGMLAAHVVARLKRRMRKKPKLRRRLRPLFAVGTILFFALYVLVALYIYPRRYDDRANNLAILQMHSRKFVWVGFAGAIVCSVFSFKALRKLLGNPVSRFISAISYQIYMWHSWIALRLKDLHIPSYATDRPMDDEAWRWPYVFLSLGITLAVSVLITYFVERPISKFCLDHAPRWARPKQAEEEPKHE